LGWLQIIRKERSVGVKPSVPTIYEVRLLIWPVVSLTCHRISQRISMA
jgi:hypothetical protein